MIHYNLTDAFYYFKDKDPKVTIIDIELKSIDREWIFINKRNNEKVLAK